MRIALAQFNPTVGDVINNAQGILSLAKEAHLGKASLVIFPELSLIGYPPKDLLYRSELFEECQYHLDWLARHTPIDIILGAPFKENQVPFLTFNAAYLIQNHTFQVVTKKCLIPNYNVFDEKRYFAKSDKPNGCGQFEWRNKRFLLSICEDAWNDLIVEGQPFYPEDPIAESALHRTPDVLINISASPYAMKKPVRRERIFQHLAKRYQRPVLVVGQVGGNDQLLFDGHSLVINAEGHIIEKATPCEEELIFWDVEKKELEGPKPKPAQNDDYGLLYDALAMGIRDYVSKCRGEGVVIGLSGGIDSSLTAALCTKALGKENVWGIAMPSAFSADSSLKDAKAQAQILGIRFDCIPIEELVEKSRDLLKPFVTDASLFNQDIADQNVQSRVRGVLLMALTNLYRKLLITTSNKSELAVGYCTIYGDMCGAISPLGDLYKTQVYALAKYINKINGHIPINIINKIPTAELKYNQTDQDTLPPYDVLDAILFRYIDEEKTAHTIAQETGFLVPLIESVASMIKASEYKRRQAPMPLMVSDKVFGDARRLPIAKQIDY